MLAKDMAFAPTGDIWCTVKRRWGNGCHSEHEHDTHTHTCTVHTHKSMCARAYTIASTHVHMHTSARHHQTGLTITAQGLGLDILLHNFLKAQSDPNQLVLVINLAPDEQTYHADMLELAGVRLEIWICFHTWAHIHNCSVPASVYVCGLRLSLYASTHTRERIHWRCSCAVLVLLSDRTYVL
jgi:hypothetical protein